MKSAMMGSRLTLALIALFAAGCSTMQPVEPELAGAAAIQGLAGDAGAKGNTELAGVAGPTGRTGAVGARGAIGPAGPQGAGAAIGIWTSFRDFWFDSNKSDLQSSDSGKASDIAHYLSQNPGQQAGIDGSIDPNNTDLSYRRINAVRTALLQAGVPSDKIRTGTFGDQQQQRDRRVEVLMSNR